MEQETIALTIPKLDSKGPDTLIEALQAYGFRVWIEFIEPDERTLVEGLASSIEIWAEAGQAECPHQKPFDPRDGHGMTCKMVAARNVSQIPATIVVLFDKCAEAQVELENHEPIERPSIIIEETGRRPSWHWLVARPWRPEWPSHRKYSFWEKISLMLQSGRRSQ